MKRLEPPLPPSPSGAGDALRGALEPQPPTSSLWGRTAQLCGVASLGCGWCPAPLFLPEDLWFVSG